MKRAKPDRRSWIAAARILFAGLPLLLVAAGSSAQDADAKRRALMTQQSEIELGFLWNHDDSNAFGDYTGLANEGFYVLGNGDIRYRTAWDDPEPRYLRLRGLNLGLDSREIFAEAKEPGRFGAFLTFDQIPKYWNEGGRSFFFKQGDSGFTLPSTWTAVAPNQTATISPGLFRDVDSRTMRQTFGGGFSAVPAENVDVDAAYSYMHRWGRYFTGAAMGLTGGNPEAVTLPERIDETTQTWETAVAYAIDLLQLDLQYDGSRYTDHEDSVTWVNPYTVAGNWGAPSAPAGYPGSGRKDQAPDNWFHQLVASGGYNLPWWNTRITANGAFGWMLQDDKYLPYTVNPAFAASINFPLPRNSLDGQINTYLVNFQVHSEPIERSRLDLRYRYDDRDNQTPRDVYVYVVNDTAPQANSLASAQARRNRPYSYTQNHVDFEAGYEIFDRTELTLGYDWTQTERDLQEAKEVWENGVGAELYSRPARWLTARAHYRHSWRDNSDYKGTNPEWYGWSPQFLATFDPATDFENHPLLRKYYMAKAETDAVGALFSATPIDTVGIGINVDWAHDDFTDTDLGLTDREFFTAGLDVSWAATERLTTNAFYSYDHFTSEQKSWSFGAGACAAPTNPACLWEGKDKDRGHTVGTGFHLDVLPERLGLDAQYLFSWIRGTTGVDFGPALGTDFPYPNERTRIQSASVGLDFQATEQIGMRVGYLFERMSTRDWALDGVGPTTMGTTTTNGASATCNGNSCVIASGQQSPEATSHLVSWSVYYKFFW